MTDTGLNPEHLLIGLALTYYTTVDDSEVTAADFADPRCEAVWDAARRLRTAGSPTDPASIAQALRGTPGPNPVWLAERYGRAPVRALTNHYSRLVVDGATRRRLRAAATRITQMSEQYESAQEAVEHARSEVDDCTRAITDTYYLADSIAATIASLDEPPVFTPTPWTDLNHLIGGWRPGCLYVIGARPGAGKTILGVQAAINLARNGHVALSSLEMGRAEIDKRILAQVAQVPLKSILDGTLNPAERHRINQIAPTVKALPLSVDDRSSVRPIDVRSHARSVARKGPLKAVILDYVGLMDAASGDKRNRQEVVSSYSRELKALARDLNVPVLVLTQLNRNPAERSDQRPVISDIRESGALEQDADVVLLLSVPEEDPSILHLAVGKNRHGPTGSIELVRRGHLARLDNYGWEPRTA